MCKWKYIPSSWLALFRHIYSFFFFQNSIFMVGLLLVFILHREALWRFHHCFRARKADTLYIINASHHWPLNYKCKYLALRCILFDILMLWSVVFMVFDTTWKMDVWYWTQNWKIIVTFWTNYSTYYLLLSQY